MLWSRLLSCDFKRSQFEPEHAPVMFIDSATQMYHMPTDPFPIDPIVEATLSRDTISIHGGLLDNYIALCFFGLHP